MKEVTIYTDGACSGNPGPGGWGVILMYGEHSLELSGGDDQTTNNRMELLGVISALKRLKEPCKVRIFTDSKYVSDAYNKGWVVSWRKNNWRRKDGPVKNPDLWKTLTELTDTHEVQFIWVKGHADNEFNNRCDQLAVMERDRHSGK